MYKGICTLSFIILSIFSTWAQPGSYYSGTQNLQGYRLKTKLHEIIARKTISWNYGDLPVFYEQTDRDFYYENDSSLLDIYSENPVGVDPYNYYYQNNSLISGASTEGLGWNREHIYSQSFFNSYYPMYSDLHFILPTDARVNQRRSNYPYAKVGNAAFTSLNGTKVGPSATANYTNTVTEPIDEFKGDVARMLMYVAVRYENLLPFFEYANVRNPIDSLSEKSFKDWYIPLLLSWHQQDPVSQKEIARNNAVFSIQGNRNPFIDHPEWVQSIWGNLPTDITVPDAPFQVSVLGRGRHFITVEWPYVQGNNIAGYEILLNGNYAGTTSGLTYTFDRLLENTSYDIAVRTYSTSYVKSVLTTSISVTTAVNDTFAEDLLISKLITGTANNKAIEISNKTGHPVDLRHYYLNMRQQNNTSGALYWSANKIQLEGVLAPGKKLVIINPKAQLACFPVDSADIVSNGLPMTFDGTLAIDLLHDNITIDRIGNADVRVSFANGRSLYRKDTVRMPLAVYDSTEWNMYPLDYCDGLGNPPDDPTRIAEAGKELLFIYPNPVAAGGYIYIEGTLLQKAEQAQLQSMDGRVLVTYKKQFLKSGRLQLPEQVVPGLYILLINGQAYKLLVQ